jgi:Zn-finger nucleic acid-binding protein
MSVTKKCVVCSVDFVCKSLNGVEKYCPTCFGHKTDTKAMLDMKKRFEAQVIALEDRMEKLEKVNSIMEDLIESSINAKLLSVLNKYKHDNKNIDNLENNILSLNNKLVKIIKQNNLELGK